MFDVRWTRSQCPGKADLWRGVLNLSEFDPDMYFYERLEFIAVN